MSEDTKTEVADETSDMLRIKVDLTLTKEQVRDYLGNVIIEKGVQDKMGVTVIRDLIRQAVQVNVLSAKMDWDLLATDDQISQVEAAVDRILPTPAQK